MRQKGAAIVVGDEGGLVISPQRFVVAAFGGMLADRVRHPAVGCFCNCDLSFFSRRGAADSAALKPCVPTAQAGAQGNPEAKTEEEKKVQRKEQSQRFQPSTKIQGIPFRKRLPKGLTLLNEFLMQSIREFHGAVTVASGLKIIPWLVLLFMTTRRGPSKHKCRTHSSSSNDGCSLSHCQSIEPSPASGFTVK